MMYQRFSRPRFPWSLFITFAIHMFLHDFCNRFPKIYCINALVSVLGQLLDKKNYLGTAFQMLILLQSSRKQHLHGY